MSIDTPLARLTAGLDRSHEAATFALESERLHLDGLDHPREIEYQWVRFSRRSPEGQASTMFFGGAPGPREVLAQVEAIRKVLAVCDVIDAAALDGEWWEGHYGDRADDIREALAGIYEPGEGE